MPDLKTVSLHLPTTTLAAALQSIADQADIDLVYSDAAVDSLLVSADFNNLPVDKALHHLLRRTSISFERKSRGEFVLFLKLGVLNIDVSGLIVDAVTGETLPSANVALLNSSRGTSSNLQGRFVLPSMPFTDCSLRISYIGYADQTLLLQSKELAQPLHIAMRQQTLVGEPVTVQPQNWELAEVGDGAGEVALAPENVALLPLVGGRDVLRSLQLLPGVSSSQGTAELFVRGGTPSQNLVLFDGMTLYHLDHSFGFFSAFNSDAIKDVRVFKSGFPAKYGGRLSGVMEITAKSGDFKHPRLHVGANLLSGQSVLELPFAGNGALLLSLRRSYSSYILNDLYDRNFNAFTSSIPRRQAPGFVPGPTGVPSEVDPSIAFYDVIGKASLAPGRRDNLTTSFYAGKDNLDRFESQPTPAQRGMGPHRRQESNFMKEESADWGNRGASFTWNREWRETLHSTAMIAYSNYSSDQSYFENALAVAPDPRFSGHAPAPDTSPPDSAIFELNSSNEIEDISVRWDNTFKLHPAHDLEFGSWISSTRVRYSNSGFHVVDDLRETERATQQAYYAQDSWRPGGGLLLTGGLRATYYDLTSESYLEPRLSASYGILPSVSLKGAWGRSHQFVRRMPSFFQYTDGRDFWVLADGEAIKPGAAEHLAAGTKLESGNLLFDLEFYRNRQDDLTEGIPSVQYLGAQARSAIFHDNHSISRGLDALLQTTSGRFSGWIGYSLSDTKITALVDRRLQEFPANQDIRHKLNLVASTTRNGWNLSATWSYASGAPVTQPEVERVRSEGFGEVLRLTAPAQLNTGRLPASHRLDVSLTRAFATPHVYGHLGFSIYNLYDQDNVWYRNFVLREGAVVKEDIKGLGVTPTVSLDLRLR